MVLWYDCAPWMVSKWVVCFDHNGVWTIGGYKSEESVPTTMCVHKWCSVHHEWVRLRNFASQVANWYKERETAGNERIKYEKRWFVLFKAGKLPQRGTLARFNSLPPNMSHCCKYKSTKYNMQKHKTGAFAHFNSQNMKHWRVHIFPRSGALGRYTLVQTLS